MQDDRAFIRWAAKVERHWIPPGAAADMIREDFETDVTDPLRTVEVPVLFLTRIGWEEYDQKARWLAPTMPARDAQVLPAGDAMPWLGDTGPFVEAIERFIRAHREPMRRDRTLATVLFTDIVDSTLRMAELGDEAWTDIVERHHAIVRRALVDSGGSEIDTAGTGSSRRSRHPRLQRVARSMPSHV